MTPAQLKILHIAKARVFGRDGDPSYRVLLHNVAGVASSKDLDNRAFEDVMAVLEDSGFRDTRGPDYWRSKVRHRSAECGERMAGKIHQLAQGGRYELPAMCRRFSAGRTDQVEKLLPREAWKLIEALKSIASRETKHADGQGRLFAGKDAAGSETPLAATRAALVQRPAELDPVTDDEIPF